MACYHGNVGLYFLLLSSQKFLDVTTVKWHETFL
jgi:hypothetical protein